MTKKLLFSNVFFLITLIINAQNGMHFDGTNDMVQTNYPGIIGNGARTIEAWIKTTTVTSSAQKVIVDWGTSTTGGRSTFCMLQNNSIRFEAGGNGIAGTLAVNNGAWHHVAVVYNPSATNTVSLYIDGALNNSGNLTVAVNTVAGTNLRIGQRFDGINNFNGSIDEVRIWNVARTASEISTYKNIEFCSPQTGLVAYYKFNLGIPSGTNTGITTTDDYSGNNYTGTLSGFALTGATSNFVSGASLTLNTIDTSVTNDNAGTLTANQTGAIYQWVDCATSTLISGANSQSFSPTTTGLYAAIVNYNGCISTTICSNVTTLKNTDFSFENSITMYPNPSNGIVTIQTNDSYETIDVVVKNSIGQIVIDKQFSNTNAVVMDINSASGMYFITLKTNLGKQATLKFIKL